MHVRVLIPSGVLGLGFDQAALDKGVALSPDIICIDGGSTDSGPFYLGTATSKYSRSATRAQWRRLLLAREKAGVPLVIGSAGTCGADATVDWMLEMTAEIATELTLQLTVATLYSEQRPSVVAEALSDGRITALEPEIALQQSTLEQCSHIVALAGVEQLQAALDTGADVVIAGRATDTASICALPLQRGVETGIAWHGAKIAECGAFCSSDPGSGVIMVDFQRNSFTVTALGDNAICTPHSVSAHMLYENVDPYRLTEPGGVLDVSGADYAAVDEQSVRVTGACWQPAEHYTVKLEGARLAGYQTTILAVIREPRYVQNAQQWTDTLKTFVSGEIETAMALTELDYDLEFRLMGINAALGKHETQSGEPVEVGVLGIITAPDADTAEEIGKLINPFVLHHPLTRDEPLPTFAFPYSPAQSERGPLYEFALNHVMLLDDPMSAFRLTTHQLRADKA